MLKEYKYKTELHAHTKPISSCSEIPPEELVELYHNLGYESVAITNHFEYNVYGKKEDENELKNKIKTYIDGYYKVVEEGAKLGLNVILGAELRFMENSNDYLIYGIEPEELYEIANLLEIGIDAFYKKYKNDKNIIIQAHPFRDGMQPVNPESLDGIEVFNVHPGHNSRIGFAAKLAKEHNKIITCGTDYHHHGHEGLCGILTKEPITDSIRLAEILKNKDYIIDIGGYKVLPE